LSFHYNLVIWPDATCDRTTHLFTRWSFATVAIRSFPPEVIGRSG